MENILLSIDFHDNTPSLVRNAVQLARPFDAKLWLIHVSAPDPAFVGFDAGPETVRNQRAQELLNEHGLLKEYADLIRGEGLKAEGLLIQGATVERILEKTDELDIDLIITGHHEHGFLYNALFGSVSKEILKKTNVPVLLYPM